MKSIAKNACPNNNYKLMLIVSVLLLHRRIKFIYSFVPQNPINKSSFGSPILSSNSQRQLYNLKEIPRVSPELFSPEIHYFHETDQIAFDKSTTTPIILQYETPVIIENAFDPSECSNICDEISSKLGSYEIQVQRKRQRTRQQGRQNHLNNEQQQQNQYQHLFQNTQVDLYDCTLHQAFDLMMQSKHNDSIFAFCEGLLDDNLPNIKKRIHQCQESLFQPFQKSKQTQKQKQKMNKSKHDNDKDVYNEDWFPYFPPEIRPTDCVVLAGEGATSTLHRDPFEWTGSSLCLEGTKIWRFIPPPIADLATATNKNSGNSKNKKVDIDETLLSLMLEEEEEDSSGVHMVDEFLNAYRLESIAWNDHDDKEGNDDDNDNDNDEDDCESHSIPISAGWQSDKSLFAFRNDNIKSAIHLANMEEPKKIQYLNKIALDKEKLQSNIFQNATKHNHTPLSKSNPNSNSKSKSSSSSSSSIPLATTIWTTVQKPGDLLIIPAYWWHQTYAPEPSLAIASQRCGSERDASRVMNHMMQTSGMIYTDDFLERLKSSNNSEEYMNVFFQHLLDHNEFNEIQ